MTNERCVFEFFDSPRLVELISRALPSPRTILANREPSSFFILEKEVIILGLEPTSTFLRSGRSTKSFLGAAGALLRHAFVEEFAH